MKIGESKYEKRNVRESIYFLIEKSLYKSFSFLFFNKNYIFPSIGLKLKSNIFWSSENEIEGQGRVVLCL